MSKNNEYTAKAYEDLLLLIKESDVFDQIFKVGVSGSFNDGEGVEGWSDLDILFI